MSHYSLFVKSSLSSLCVCSVAMVACASAPSAALDDGPVESVSSAATSIPEPSADSFYVPPAGWASKSPGTVLRSRSVSVSGITESVKATQMLLRSTDTHGLPIAISSILMVPTSLWLIGDRPLVSYQPAIDSLGDQCNPSYTLRAGGLSEAMIVSNVLDQGWAVVVTDFEGPRNSWSAGIITGYTVLDGIRAAERLPGTGLAGTSTRVGLMGYSGGGLATGWAAQMQPSYAPELKLKGAVLGGASDLAVAGQNMDGGIFSGLYLAAVVGMSREYPELLSYLNQAGRTMCTEMADLCATDLLTSYAFKRLDAFTTIPNAINAPGVKPIIDANALGGVAPTVPIYMYHSIVDELAPFSGAVAIKDRWCAKGAKVNFDSAWTGEHVLTAVTASPAAIAFLGGRFINWPVVNDCD